MNDLETIRRNNVRKYMKRKFPTAQEFAKAVGVSPCHLSQMIGKGEHRPVSDAMARRFEVALGLPPGAFDAGAPPAFRSPMTLVERLERLERAVGVA